MLRIPHVGRRTRTHVASRKPPGKLRRPLFMESLEDRRLLAVTIIEETFKATPYSIVGSFQGVTDIPSLSYHDEFSGDTSDFGTLAYTSATNGQGLIHLDGTGSGLDTCSSYSFLFEGDGTLADQGGSLSRSNVSFSDFDLSSVDVNCIYRGPLVLEQDASGSFDTSDLTAELLWSVAVEDGTSSGTWTGQLVFEDDLLDIQPTSAEYEDGILDVAFTVSGAPSAAASHTTPIAVMEVFWADGPTAADVMGSPVAAPIPIYWNQAGGRAQISDLAPAPATATHLLVIADATDDTAELDETNNVLRVGPAWQNVANPLDVDGDGEIVPLDAHKVITSLNLVGARKLADPPQPPDVPPPFYDVDGDGWLAPIDALLIINYRNRLLNGGEGESSILAASDESLRNAPAQPILMIGLEVDPFTSIASTPDSASSDVPGDPGATVDAAMLEYLSTDPCAATEPSADLTETQTTKWNPDDLLANEDLLLIE